jgi:hypothetical protein
MLHGYKKSRYNIYDNLEFLGLNLYEQKHFCFGEGGGGGGDGGGDGDPGGEAEAGYDMGFSAAAQEAAAAQADMAAAEAASAAQAAELSQAQIDEAYAMALADPTIDVAFSLDPSMVDLDVLNELQKNYYGMLADWAALDDPNINTKKLIQREIKKRRLNTPRYGIYNPEAMNRLEKLGYKTFGTGIRGPYEARFVEPQTRQTYDPNNVTFASPDPATTAKYQFTEFALQNPNLTTVEALTQYNAISPVDSKVSVEDVQNMGYDLNAPVGPQASFNEAERDRGLAQGLGLVAQTIATGSPIGALTDVALSGTGKGVMGHMADMFEEATGVNLPKAPDLGIPSYEEMAVGLVGPEEDTMDPSSFGIEAEPEAYSLEDTFGIQSFDLDFSPPTDEEVGYVGYEDFTDYSRRYRQPRPTSQPQPLEVAAAEETPAIPFNLGRATTPPSRVSRIANIYGIDEDAAKRMLGIV